MLNFTFSASIVLYKNNPVELMKAINSFYNQGYTFTLYLIDNSPLNDLQWIESHNSNIIYIHNPSNPGFGVAQNIAIKEALSCGSNYHFIVNPDIYFTHDVVTKMITYMHENTDVGMMMPSVLNEDGTVQNLPKLLPSPLSILLRKLKKPEMIYNRFIEKYELRFVHKDVTYNSPILSGCFTLLNLTAIKEIGMYDDRYFMYFEDWDLSRRMHQKYKTIYFPEVSVYHGYDSGANKSSRLFMVFVKSAFAYFNKWGWFFDIERKDINRETLNQFI
ncbi:MAG: glycosyltransferase family 2 protein [Pedobacter sp.]|uniref:glycosyltransferase n=1 Tax=Pedobacter sp. TaxID=1411316 RepID=UPI003563E5D6